MRLLLVLLFVWMLEYSSASDFTCSYNSFHRYTCETKNFHLQNENTLIESDKVQHLPRKTQFNVEVMTIEDSKNKFLSSDIFKLFPNLIYLTVGDSVEKIVRENFDGAQHLKYININHNKISELTDNIFSGAFNLHTVDINFNVIRSISNKTFAGLTKLEGIDVAYNCLESLPRGIFDDLINLNSLRLYKNNLTRLDGDLFKYNFKIESLEFSKNSLSFIGSNLIKNLKSLKNAEFYNNTCISAKFPATVNINVLNEMIAQCPKSKKKQNNKSSVNRATIYVLLGSILLLFGINM